MFKSQYKLFTSEGALTPASYFDLVRLCGYIPVDDGTVPKSYEEFEEKLKGFKKPLSPADLEKELLAYNNDLDSIHTTGLVKILNNHISPQEMEDLYKIIRIDRDGFVSLKEMIEDLSKE